MDAASLATVSRYLSNLAEQVPLTVLSEGGAEVGPVSSSLRALQSEVQSQLQEEQVSGNARSILVEIDKQVRLLQADLLFLQSAKQAQTLEQRRQQVRARLDRLAQYQQLWDELGMES